MLADIEVGHVHEGQKIHLLRQAYVSNNQSTDSTVGSIVSVYAGNTVMNEDLDYFV